MVQRSTAADWFLGEQAGRAWEGLPHLDTLGARCIGIIRTEFRKQQPHPVSTCSLCLEIVVRDMPLLSLVCRQVSVDFPLR